MLKECAEAGYKGIELGPVGFMPEDPVELGEGLAKHDLTLIGGVVFRPYHDPDAWEDVLDATHRTARALKAHGAEHLVLIDSISPRRAPTAGRAAEAEQMDKAEWQAYRDRIAESARIGAEEYGLTVGIHAHAAGFMDFEPELERLLDEVDESLLKICFDTGHHSYAGFDPVTFMKKHVGRISYMHFKDIDPTVKADVIANRTGFYDACGQGIFCNLGERFNNGRLKAGDVILVIGAGLRGAGYEVSDEEVSNMQVEGGAAGFVSIVADLLKATFGDDGNSESEWGDG